MAEKINKTDLLHVSRTGCFIGKIEFGFHLFEIVFQSSIKKNTDQRMYCLKNVKNDVPFVLPSGLRREDMCGLSRRNLEDRRYLLL